LKSSEVEISSHIEILGSFCFSSCIGWFISSGRGPQEKSLPREFRIYCLLVIVVSIVG
jgi:hypothetical protein